MLLTDFLFMYGKGVLFFIIAWILSRSLTSLAWRIRIRSFAAAVGLGIAVVPGHGAAEGLIPIWYYLLKGLRWLVKANYPQALLYLGIGFLFLIPWWIIFSLIFKPLHSRK